MFTVVKILELLPKEGSLEIKTLEKMLKLTKKIERTRLKIAIDALNKLGIVQKETEDHIQKGDLSNTIFAKIRCSSKGYSFAIRDDGLEDIYIREKFLNNAWHGDKVLVRINKEALKRRSPEGIVLCVLERSKTNILATVKENEGKIIAQPLDERILSTIELPQDDSKYIVHNDNDNIVDIEIKKFPIAQILAQGKISRSLSLSAGIQGDLEILKTKHNIPQLSKPPKVALKKPSDTKRRDLQNQKCILMKSWTGKKSPILPALYSEPYQGGFKLWIHVPTVGERINFGSKLDEWIKIKSKSICLGSSWESILSENLLNDAKLKVGEKSLAITLEIVLDKSGNCKSTEFYLSSIKPAAEISPIHLEVLHNRKPKARLVPSKLKPIKEYISTIEEIVFISKLINTQLISKGYIQLDISIPVDEIYGDLSFEGPGSNYEGWNSTLDLTDPQSILNILCIFSNKILASYLDSININYIALSKSLQEAISLNDIIKSVLVLDGEITLDEEGLISFNDLMTAASNNTNKRIIDKLIKNSIIDFRYKLGFNTINDINSNLTEIKEAPWTSPAFNYADIVNQLILFKVLSEAKIEEHKLTYVKNLASIDSEANILNIFTKTQLSMIDKHCNDSQIRELNNNRERAKAFRESLIAMIQLRCVQQNLKQRTIGTITGVQSYGFFVELEHSLAEGLVHVSSLDDDWYEYRSRQNLLIGRKNKKTYQIGDKVNVVIEKIDLLRNQIDLNIVSQEEQNSDEAMQVLTQKATAKQST